MSVAYNSYLQTRKPIPWNSMGLDSGAAVIQAECGKLLEVDKQLIRAVATGILIVAKSSC